MEGAASRRHRGELFAALAAMGFGSAYVATSFALVAFEPVPAAAWRAALAMVAVGCLLVVRAWRTHSGEPSKGSAAASPGVAEGAGVPEGQLGPGRIARGIRLFVLSTLAGPVFLSAMNLAVDHVGAAIAAFVAGLYAVLAAVIAPLLLPERLTWRVLAGFVLAVIGTLLLAELDPAATDVTGIGWGVLAAVSFAVYLVLTRRWSSRYRLDGLTVAFSNSAVTAAVLGAALLVADPASLVPASPPVSALAALAWMAIVAALGPVLTVGSLRLIPAARSAAFLLLNPVTATTLAFVLLGERPSTLQIAGGLLVLAGMAAATIPARAGRATALEGPRREAVP